MSKKIIAVDMDGILVDLLGKWLGSINREHGLNVKSEDIDDWEMGNCVKLKPLGKKVYEYLERPGFFFDDVQPIPGAIEGFNALRKLPDSHVIIVTSATSKEHPVVGKLHWLKKFLPDFSQKDVIFAYHKHLIKADVWIDDSDNNHKSIMEQWTNADHYGIQYAYNGKMTEYNKGCVRYFKNDGTAWEKIVAHVSYNLHL